MTLIGILLTSLITLVQLNCENFFDCYDDSTKNDNEFTPESLRGWSHKKFRQKADHLSQEIISAAKMAMIGTCPTLWHCARWRADMPWIISHDRHRSSVWDMTM